MRRSIAALLFALAAVLGAGPALAQNKTAPAASPQAAPLEKIISTELSPERMALATKLVEVTRSARLFDQLLPNVADKAKNAFIRANPQMQLGIISVVDKIAVQLVSRRPELDNYLARVWASGFTDEEMQELIDFYSTDTGKKYATILPQLVTVQTAAAEEWAKSVNEELTVKVREQLSAAVAAESQALQSDVAGPAADGTTPPPAPAQ